MISDDELNALLAPSNQLYTGEIDDPDPASRDLPLLGQLNPVTARELASEHGRFLSGLGDDSMEDTEKQFSTHADVMDMEAQDDVLGSGIFDPFRRPPTVNAQTGVFESKYSLPGYHARETPFMVNHEITDISNGAEVVGIPSGGLNYVDHGGPRPYLDSTNQFEPYAETGKDGGSGWTPDNTFAPGERLMSEEDVRSFASAKHGDVARSVPFNEDPRILAKRKAFKAPGHLARDSFFETKSVSESPQRSLVAWSPEQSRLARTPTVNPTVAQIPAATKVYSQSRPAAPYENVNARAVSPRGPSPFVTSKALAGFGEAEGESMGPGAYVALFGAGLLAGVALRILIPKKG